jgi:hypothetical protein
MAEGQRMTAARGAVEEIMRSEHADMLRERGHVAKAQQPLVSGAIRQLFHAADGNEARERLAQVVEQLAGPEPKVAELLEAAEPDLLAFYAFPRDHWSKLRSTDENVKSPEPSWKPVFGRRIGRAGRAEALRSPLWRPALR